MKQPKVTIVILNYNQDKETARCLEEVHRLTYPNCEVLVVDNGSRQNPEPLLKDRFPKVHWERLQENAGFAGGCNHGIRWGLSRGAEAILLLNNDAVIEVDFLEKMVASAYADPKTGVVGGVIYPSSGPVEPFLAGMRFDFLQAKILRIVPEPSQAGGIGGGCSVPAVSGSALLIKKELLDKIDLLDERFFIYFEETDFCYRARKSGMQVIYHPDVRIQHEEGSTFGRGSPTFRYFYTRNRLLFLSKHCPFWIRPWSFSVRILQDLLLFVILWLQGKREASRAVRYGFVDYWKGRFGKGRLTEFFHG